MRKKKEKRSTYSLSGWIFADLLLGLTMVFFLANSRGTPLQLTATPTPTTHVKVTSPIFTETSLPTATVAVTPTATATRRATITATHTVTTTATATTTATPNSAPMPVGMTLKPICYNISVDLETMLQHRPDEYEKHLPSISKDLKKVLPNDPNVRIGMILVWGNGGNNVSQGVEMAKHVLDVITRDFPDSFRSAASKSLFSSAIEGGIGTIQIELYLFSDSKWEKSPTVKCWSG